MRKRILALCMALCMMLTLAPAAFAADTSEFTSGNLVYRITDETSKYVEVCNVSGSSITEITIPATVDNNDTPYTVVGIASGAFGSRPALTNTLKTVTMPQDSALFTYIGSDAFYGCAAVTSLTIPASVTTIGSTGEYGGQGTFGGMTALTTVTFGNGSQLKNIPTNAFSGCTALSSITLPDGLEAIGNAAFAGCTALSSLSVPSSVTTLSPNAFVGYYSSDNGTPNVTIESGGKYKLVDGVLYDDTSLLKAYEFCETVVVPEGITTIGENAFASATQINDVTKSITLPKSLTTIGDGAFVGCTALETVDFQDNTALTAIPNQAFAMCFKLSEIKIPEGVTSIGSEAFLCCTSLQSITLPEGLKTIGDMAFMMVGYSDGEPDLTSGNDVIKYINIPASVKSVGVGFLGGVNTSTALIFEGMTLPEFASREDEGDALTFISGEFSKPVVFYPSAAKDAYTGEGSALLTAGLVTAPSDDGGENQKEQGYALPATVSGSVVVESAYEIGSYTSPTGADLSVTSSDTSVATVSTENGKITVSGISAGSVTITAKITKDSFTLAKATYSITVAAKPVPVTGVTLSETSLSLRESKTATLTATVMPEDATNKNVTWTSSNPDVATVENGVVTAVSKGEATITVTTEDGSKTATCTVTVTKKSSSGSSSSASYTVSAEKAEDGKITVSPAKAEKGDTVTITVKPDSGYVLDELVITDKNGKEISYKEKSENKFTFTMPGSKVTVEATFAPEKDEDKTIVLTLGSTLATVYGTPVINDVAPVARNNRTMLPIRFVAEALGARVDWDQAQQKVTITRDALVIEIYLGSDVAYVNGAPVQLDSPAFAENNRTYLPLRFVAENLGATVEWDAATQTVTITAA